MPTTETRLQWYRIAQEDELPVGRGDDRFC